MKIPDIDRLRTVGLAWLRSMQWEARRMAPATFGFRIYIQTVNEAASLSTATVREMLAREDRLRASLDAHAHAVRARGDRDPIAEDEDLPKREWRCLGLRDALRGRGELP